MDERIDVPVEMLGRQKDCFVLRVRGDSMIEEHIRDGDYVVVESRSEARNGETVVALVRGSEATLKKFYRRGAKVVLEPAQPGPPAHRGARRRRADPGRRARGHADLLSVARPTLSRREFVSGLVGSGVAAAAAAAGCGAGIEVSDAERAALEAQLRDDPIRSGTGRLGSLRFRGYRGLAELPWFELRAGQLHMVDETVPAGIDTHTHLGMSYLFAPEIDLNASSERVIYHLDCDAQEPGCELDLDVYMNGNFTPHELTSLRFDTLRSLTIGSADAATATLPNLAAELTRMGMEKAAVLPIALRLPFGGDATDAWLDAIDQAQDPGRFVRGGSVHPRSSGLVARVEALAARGVRILKLHPEVQRFRPDAPEVMPVYEACQRLGVSVIFHAGRSGIEPESVRPFALPRHFTAVLEEFPDLTVVLGHGGARDFAEMLEVARPHPERPLRDREPRRIDPARAARDPGAGAGGLRQRLAVLSGLDCPGEAPDRHAPRSGPARAGAAWQSGATFRRLRRSPPGDRPWLTPTRPRLASICGRSGRLSAPRRAPRIPPHDCRPDHPRHRVLDLPAPGCAGSVGAGEPAPLRGRGASPWPQLPARGHPGG